MKVLVSAGSKHGATTEIAAAIADTLTAAGHEVVALCPERVTSVAGFDAVVLGSAVYAGRWIGSARQLVEREGAVLKARPVWLFSSGPIGTPPKPEEEPADVGPIRAATGARDHRLFAGLVDRGRLGLGEKAILAMLKTPDGDFRPWDDIRAWAGEVAAAIAAIPAPLPGAGPAR
jgi:menaquinone-dependent protoporphyrinogen oxidase